MPNPCSPAQLPPLWSGRDTLSSGAHLDPMHCTQVKQGATSKFICCRCHTDTLHTQMHTVWFHSPLNLTLSFKVKCRPRLLSITMPKQDCLLVKDHAHHSTRTATHEKCHHKTHFQMHHLSFLYNHSNQTIEQFCLSSSKPGLPFVPYSQLSNSAARLPFLLLSLYWIGSDLAAFRSCSEGSCYKVNLGKA